MYPEKTEALIKKDTRTPAFIVALFTMTKIWKQTKCPSADEWMKNSTRRKNEILSSATTSIDQATGCGLDWAGFTEMRFQELGGLSI